MFYFDSPQKKKQKKPSKPKAFCFRGRWGVGGWEGGGGSKGKIKKKGVN